MTTALSIVSLCIASVALVFSGLSLYLNWYNARRDAPNVTINFQWNMERRYDDEGKLLDSFGYIWVRNKGRRPIYIDIVALKVPGRSYYENLLTAELCEGRTISEADTPLKVRFNEASVLLEAPDQWQDIRAIAFSADTEYVSAQGVSQPAKKHIYKWTAPKGQLIEVDRRR